VWEIEAKGPCITNSISNKTRGQSWCSGGGRHGKGTRWQSTSVNNQVVLKGRKLFDREYNIAQEKNCHINTGKGLTRRSVKLAGDNGGQ